MSQHLDASAVRSHIDAGCQAVVREDEAIIHYKDGAAAEIAWLEDIPMVYGGAAHFMVENALAASGAAIGLGFSIEQIADGLATFRNDSRTNKGRLNTFEVEGRTVVIDYAHNDVGLRGLTQFSRHVCGDGGRLHLVVGTAGDRRDEDFMALGGVA
ncbi:MAG: cyanophycin synthetase [Thermomicrobiales bacterium]